MIPAKIATPRSTVTINSLNGNAGSADEALPPAESVTHIETLDMLDGIESLPAEVKTFLER